MTTRIEAKRLYDELLKYLGDNGWNRDGDDPGAWFQGGGLNPPETTFGDALTVQLLQDGINLQWTS